jgi:hypothetical protein
MNVVAIIHASDVVRWVTEVDVIVAESTDLGKERHVQQNLQFITVTIASILKLALGRQ